MKMAVMIGTRKIAILLCLAYLLSSCSSWICGDTTKAESISPNGRVVARFIERNCGATTDYASRVELQFTSDWFNPKKEVVFIVNGSYDISLEWADPKILTITCPGCVRRNIFRQVVAIGSFDVKYRLGHTDGPSAHFLEP